MPPVLLEPPPLVPPVAAEPPVAPPFPDDASGEEGVSWSEEHPAPNATTHVTTHGRKPNLTSRKYHEPPDTARLLDIEHPPYEDTP
jgi:hypothetical protein